MNVLTTLSITSQANMYITIIGSLFIILLMAVFTVTMIKECNPNKKKPRPITEADPYEQYNLAEAFPTLEFGALIATMLAVAFVFGVCLILYLMGWRPFS